MTAGWLEMGKPVTSDAQADADQVLQTREEHKTAGCRSSATIASVGRISGADLARHLPEEQVGLFAEAICAAS
ncbi:hypothetical protein ABZ568_09585 [Streptomyces olindensis]|uniref:Uncharacterized protein n=1 Tax=Streptomyces olindensis TaxID=358823 RepID=A0ABV2XRP3_9ACTN